MYCTELETQFGTCCMACIRIDENRNPIICEHLVIEAQDITQKQGVAWMPGKPKIFINCAGGCPFLYNDSVECYPAVCEHSNYECHGTAWTGLDHKRHLVNQGGE